MKAHYRKRKTRYEFELTGKGRTTAHGGQVLVDTLCRRFHLWERISRIEGIDPRTRKGSGHDPEAMAAQIIFTLTSGGATLADAERIGHDAVLLESVGLDKVADQTTLGEWLRAQSLESVQGLCKLNSDFVTEVIAESKPARVRHGGELEVFFDDTEIEVYGKKIEGARINYNGDLALSWQTLWAGPFLLDEELGGFGTVAECQQELLDEHGTLWTDGKSYFYADSGSSEGKLLTHTAGSGFSRWSVSYNKWTGPLERLAGEKPDSAWGDLADRNGVTEAYAWVKHTPESMDEAQTFAACRWKKPDEMFWRYAFVACEKDAMRTPRAVFERHRLKGASEQRFSEVLSDLDLHHPPCLSLIANRAFYALATLAYNVLTALKVLELDDEQQSWRVRTIVRHLLTVPATLVCHANRRKLRICLPAGMMRWWRLFFMRFIPRRKRGEGTDEIYWPPIQNE
jgi:hypothetical protein